jgi:elongation factor P
MIDVNQLRKGTTFLEDGGIWKVTNYSHHKPGRGNATIRVQVRNLRSGTIREMTYNSGERVQDIEVDKHTVEYLYGDDDGLTFMDLETYDQPHLRRELFGDDIFYLKEGMQLTLKMYEGEIIDYELPNTVDQQVVEADPSFAGDTAAATTKKCKTETGLQIQVPTFVNVGDMIRINTIEGAYMTRL